MINLIALGCLLVSIISLSTLCHASDVDLPGEPIGTRQLSEVDVVFTWVNGSDPDWLITYQQNVQGFNISSHDARMRYIDLGEVMLAVASVQQMAPWVRKIHVVTAGQRFSTSLFSDELRSKVHFVDHQQIVPTEYLPTFNCLVLELFFHRIPDLTENFIYMNDDMLWAKPLKKEDVFDMNGKFKVMMLNAPNWNYIKAFYAVPKVERGEPNWRYQYKNIGGLLSQKFHVVPSGHWHGGYFMTQQAMIEAWSIYSAHFETQAGHKTRKFAPLSEGGDISPNLLFMYLALMRGNQALDTSHTYAILGRPQGLQGFIDRQGRARSDVLFFCLQDLAAMKDALILSFCSAASTLYQDAIQQSALDCLCSKIPFGSGC